MDRVRRALSAIKMNEMARLGGEMRKAQAARLEAIKSRQASRRLTSPETAQDMALQNHWQRALEERARLAEARAAQILRDTEPLRAQLSRTLGRENVANHLIAEGRAEMRKLQDRRAEDAVIPKRTDGPAI